MVGFIIGLVAFVIVIIAWIKEDQVKQEQRLARRKILDAAEAERTKSRIERSERAAERRAVKAQAAEDRAKKKLEGPPAKYGRWRIKYTDYENEETERDIRIREVKPRNMQVIAWCELRNAERTFSIYSIRDPIDLDTGELIDVNAWLDAYTKARRKKPAATP